MEGPLRLCFAFLFVISRFPNGGSVTISVTGMNVYPVPFEEREGFIKKSFVTYTGFSTGVTLRCASSSGNGLLSIFKGPWSSPSPLVDKGIPVVMDPNLSFREDSSGYEIAISRITPENAGTYYCFALESVSEREFIERSSFLELFVQEDSTLFCLMHSYTDSVFFSDVAKAVLLCVADSPDLRDMRVHVFLSDSETQETSELDQALSFLPPMFVDLFRAAVIVYEIGVAGTEISSLNNSVLICEKSPESGLCGNIEPLRIFTNLTVLLDPAEIRLEADTVSLEFTCKSVPNVVATNVTWTISQQPFSTSRVSQTSDGSKLVLENIDLDKVNGKDFTISCSVTVGEREAVTKEARVQVGGGNGKGENTASRQLAKSFTCVIILLANCLQYLLF